MLLGQPAVRTSAFQVPVTMVAIFLPLQSSAAVSAMYLTCTFGLVGWPLRQIIKSRAMRGFLFGGPSRTRTYDQGIMSSPMTPLR